MPTDHVWVEDAEALATPAARHFGGLTGPPSRCLPSARGQAFHAEDMPEDRRFMPRGKDVSCRFTLGSNDPGPADLSFFRAPAAGCPNAEDRRFMPEDVPECPRMAEDRRFMPEDRRFMLGSNDPGPALICLSRARRWRAGHVCWVRRPTQDRCRGQAFHAWVRRPAQDRCRGQCRGRAFHSCRGQAFHAYRGRAFHACRGQAFHAVCWVRRPTQDNAEDRRFTHDADDEVSAARASVRCFQA
jgi:hypothetical protein